LRVITGSARGRKLDTPQGLDTRPTTEFVKEAMFSIIQFEIPGAFVLDLFSGSGQLGIEALSRGARFCVFVDSSRDAFAVTKSNLESTGLFKNSRLALMDSISFLKTTKDTFDIALLDPPYSHDIVAQALPLLAPKMSDSGTIICESAVGDSLPAQAGAFTAVKEYRYGKKKLTIYRNEAFIR